MKTRELEVKRITALVSKIFRTFGGGQTSDFNPLTHVLKDRAPMFAAGVDVQQVVRFVLKEQEVGAKTKAPRAAIPGAAQDG